MDNPMHRCPNCGHSWDDHDLKNGKCRKIVSRGLHRKANGDLDVIPIRCNCSVLRPKNGEDLDD